VTETATCREPEVAIRLDAATYFERARSLAPLIISEAADIENDCTVSRTVLDALTKSNLLWCMLPEALGGGGISLRDGLRIVEEISRADGSTGWAYMATSFSTAFVAGFISPETAEQYFPGDQRTLVAGQLLPRYPGTKVEGGYQVKGNFSFASGSDFATVIGAGFFEADPDGNLILDDNGEPKPFIALLPKDQVKFLGNWNVWGLAGTGSYDYAVPDTFVPDEYTMVTMSTSPVRPEDIFRFGPFIIGKSSHAANALGIATRALEEVATICTGKARPNYAGPVGESELFLLEFAKAESALQAARAFLYTTVAEGESAIAADTLTREHLTRISQAVSWILGVAADIVTFAHRWGGSQSIRKDSALGRCMRDISVATQHVLVDPMTLVNVAREILPLYQTAR
jgi:alkylation response protein AidB-like acyl-CoA dehydrogenase